MPRQLLGMFRGDEDPEVIAVTIMDALHDAMNGATMSPSDIDSADDETEPTRLEPGGGAPSNDPYGREELQQAQLDRLWQMAVYGMSEEDFGDEAIWLLDDDGNIITDFDNADDD